MIDHRERDERAEKGDPTEPTEKAERNDPMEPIEQAEPIDPMDKNEPLEAIERKEFSDHNDHRERLNRGSGGDPLMSIFSSPSSRCGRQSGEDLTDLGHDVVAVRSVEPVDADVVPTLSGVVVAGAFHDGKPLDCRHPRRVKEEGEREAIGTADVVDPVRS
jgi:hypothetical protein